MPNTYSSKWKSYSAKCKLLKTNLGWEGFPASDPGHGPERDIMGLNQRHQVSQEQDTRWAGYVPCSALPSELEKQALSPDWECSGLAEIFLQLLSLKRGLIPHSAQKPRLPIYKSSSQAPKAVLLTDPCCLIFLVLVVTKYLEQDWTMQTTGLGTGWKLRLHPVPTTQQLLSFSTIFSKSDKFPWNKTLYYHEKHCWIPKHLQNKLKHVNQTLKALYVKEGQFATFSAWESRENSITSSA